MPGFGSGCPFGSRPFGEFPWERVVLFDSLPEFHRQQDADVGEDALQRLAAALRSQLRTLRLHIRDFPLIRDPVLCRGSYDETATLTLGRKVELLGDVEQRGVDGTVGALGEFVAPGANFTHLDQGKKLVLRRASDPHNNGTILVAAVVGRNTIIPEPLLTFPEPDAIHWELHAIVGANAGERVFEVSDGYVSPVAPGWILEDGDAQYEVVQRDQFHKDLEASGHFLELEGFDGSIVGGRLRASGSFSTARVGHLIHLDTTTTNEGLYRILDVLGTASPYTLYLADKDTGLAVTLLDEVGPIHWSAWPLSTITLRTLATPQGVIEQLGSDFSFTVGGLTPTFQAASATLTTADIGKYVEVRSPLTLGNNCLVRIIAITSATVADGEYLGSSLAGAVVESGLAWALRSRAVSQGHVTVHAPSVLPYLAQDFGIEVDRQEDEWRQRIWVGRVASWLALKGHALGYEALGHISGFEVDVDALYRISQDVAALIPDSSYIVELRDDGTGRSGTAATLFYVAGSLHLSDPSALFAPHDVDRQIRVLDAAVAGNNKLYTVAEYISPTEVRFRDVDDATLPDANNGSLDWVLLRLYTTLPPLIPLYDEITDDRMAVEVPLTDPTKFFAPDTFAWNPDFSTTVNVRVLAVTVLGASDRTVTLLGPADVISLPGRWKFTDVAGIDFWVESIPVAAGPPNQWNVRVHTTRTPAVDAATDVPLTYVCDAQVFPWYIPAAKILLTTTDGTIATSGALAQERSRERLLLRFKEVRPAHVELVPRFRTEILVSTGWGVTIEAGRGIGAEIVCPAVPYYDSLPADIFDPTIFYTDTGWGVSVEPPP